MRRAEGRRCRDNGAFANYSGNGLDIVLFMLFCRKMDDSRKEILMNANVAFFSPHRSRIKYI